MTETMQTIKKLMEKQGITQRDLAKMIGVTEASVSRWMRGTRTPDIDIIELMADALGYKVKVKRKKEEKDG